MARNDIVRIFAIVMAIAGILSASATVHAAVFDPKAGWQTIETDHFRVHFAKDLTDVGKRSARILEEIYPKVTKKWDWEPWSYTEVVLLDNTDSSNGFAAVMPYNWMLIYVVPPRPDSSLAHYDDWLRMLLLHEYTHIVQIDAYGGAWIPLRILFQKTVAPAGINPTWLREGMSQYDETIFTKGGRGRGSYGEMMIRTATLGDEFAPIDVADGLGWRWPGYKAAYVYGVAFVHWLVDTYGEDKFMEFDRRVRKSLMLSMINHQARAVYGRTFYELWNEWKQELIYKYGDVKRQIDAEGETKPEAVVSPYRDEQYYAPTMSPDRAKFVYSMSTPHGFPEIRMKDIATGRTTVLAKKQGSNQFSWSPDGKSIAFAKMGAYKRYYTFFDLWLYEFDKSAPKKCGRSPVPSGSRTSETDVTCSDGSHIRRLTVGKRARDPDFHPSGEFIVFVSGDNGTDKIEKIDVKTKEVSTIVEDDRHFTQFASPRVSPDGKYIAASVWKPDQGWRIYRYDIDGKNPVALTRPEGLIIESNPVWTADGKYVVYVSDETGINNVYAADSSGKGRVRQITNVMSGVFQPAIAGKDEILVQHYTNKGFEISKIKLTKVFEKVEGLRTNVDLEIDIEQQGTDEAVQTLSDEELEPRKYLAFGHSLFLPRAIIPNMSYMDDTFFMSLATQGWDVLHWQNWTGAVTYRADANFVGWYLKYWYSRFRPTMGLMANNYAVDFGNITFDNDSDMSTTSDRTTVHFYEHRRGINAFVAYPFGKNSVSLSYFYEDHMPKTTLTPGQQAALNLGKYAGFRAVYIYGDSKEFPASISKEDGRLVRMMTSINNQALGSGPRNEQVIYAGEWREYVDLWRHNVLALRSAGGITWGDRLVQGTFGMGGAIGEGAFGGGGSFYYFPLRGLPVSALSRTRAMLFSGEYRFPITTMQRGLGTIPFFIQDISGALFADYGNAWNAHEGGCDKLSTFFDDFLLGVGGELRGDFVLGHGLPVHGRIGYAIIVTNRDRLGTLTDPILGNSIKDGYFILSLGTAF